MSLGKQFNEVAVDIPVENGWRVSKVTVDKDTDPMLLVEFSKPGERPVRATLDTEKNWFNDRIPMENYPQRRDEVQDLARRVHAAATACTP